MHLTVLLHPARTKKGELFVSKIPSRPTIGNLEIPHEGWVGLGCNLTCSSAYGELIKSPLVECFFRIHVMNSPAKHQQQGSDQTGGIRGTGVKSLVRDS